jgi:hypothetical protein
MIKLNRLGAEDNKLSFEFKPRFSAVSLDKVETIL